MGQNQGKQIRIPGLVPSAMDGIGSLGDQEGATEDASPSSSSAVPSGSDAACNMDFKTKSVRAAIDLVIENCLAGGSSNSSEGRPQSLAGKRAEPPSQDVEVITVPEDDEKEVKVVPAGQEGDAVSTDKGSSEESPSLVKPNGVHDSSRPASGAGTAEKSGEEGNTCVEPGSQPRISGGPEKTDSAEKQTAASVPQTCTSEASSSSNSAALPSSKHKESSDSSNDGEGVASVRLKTIIDRVLDNSLGGGMDLKSIPFEQRILPKIISENEAGSVNTKANDGSSNSGSKPAPQPADTGRPAADKAGGEKMEPIALCFMDHITKAVERSFSSITEEEERRAKEKATADSKTRLPQAGKAGEGSSVSGGCGAGFGGDSTVSVQDIVDRVISQTEVISKLMTTSASEASHTQSKPVVSASGTFYPDKAPAEIQPPAQHRRDPSHKEDAPRETTGRRGRPRMRSPYPEHRENHANTDNLHGNSRRGSSNQHPSEDYLQNMQAAMAKYSQSHPHSHTMAPFIATGLTTSTPNYMPGHGLHNAMMAAATSGQHRAGSHKGSAGRGSLVRPPHPSNSGQPPPLLRVHPMDRGEERSPQPKYPPTHPHHHAPSRSCGCSGCLAYFSREVERSRMVPQPQQAERGVARASHQQQQYLHQQQQQQHSPHPHPYSKPPVSASHTAGQRWPAADPRQVEAKDKHHPQHPFQYSQPVRGNEAYPASHPAYGIQTGVPVPHGVYPDKLEHKPVEPQYIKAVERVSREDYPHSHPYAHPEHEKAREGDVGRQAYAQYATPPRPAQGYPPPNSYRYEARKPEEPVLDLTYARYPPEQRVPLSVSASAEEDKPLDLSAKKPSAVSSYPERRDAGPPRMENRRHYGAAYADSPVHHSARHDREKTTSGSHHLHNLETSVETYFQKFQQQPNHARGSVGVSSAIPQHGLSSGIPQHHMSVPPQSVGGHAHSVGPGSHHQGIASGMPPHSQHSLNSQYRSGVSPQNISARVSPHTGLAPQSVHANMPHHSLNARVSPHQPYSIPPQASIQSHANMQPHAASVPHQQNTVHGGMPLPQHHTTYPNQHRQTVSGHGYSPVSSQPAHSHPPQHRQPMGSQGYPPASPQSSSSYPPDSLQSPGGRRPQLQPVPSPNLSTSAGSSAARGSHAGSTPTIPMAPGIPTHSMPSPLPVPANPASAMPPSSPQNPNQQAYPAARPFSVEMYCADFLRPNGSRSVSPPLSSDGRSEDRRRGSVSKHEPIQNILGNNNPQDILYLICRLCRQTYGSPYGFRKHFRNQHGFEPKAEHTMVQTISATKNARQLSDGNAPLLDPDNPGPEPLPHHVRPPSSESAGRRSDTASPRVEMIAAPVAEDLPGRSGSEPPGDQQLGDGNFKARGLPRSSADSKGRPPSASSSGAGEEREDTKCLECPECGQAFQLNDFGSYKRHCRQHGQGRGSAQGVYSCSECQCSFPEAGLLQEHLARHQNSPVVSVACNICRLPFPSHRHLGDHVRTAHEGAVTSQCGPLPAPVVPVPVSAASAFPSSNISSSHVSQRQTSSTASADSSMTVFNLQVTTPSDLEIRRLPADHAVTSASPDSSSDNKKGEGGECASVSSSEVKAEVKTEDKSETEVEDSPKPAPAEGTELTKIKVESKTTKVEDDKDSGYTDSCPSTDSRSISTEGSLASPLDVEEQVEAYMYKHKKFSAHRKRTGSSEATPEVETKQAKLDASNPMNQKTQQNVVSSASDKTLAKKTAGEEKTGPATPVKGVPSKTEARHQMPFVWDRVTRSQAGKNARSSDYS